MNLRQQIEGFEGRRHEAYPDPLTGADPWTIGVGHTGPEVHKGMRWSDAQIDLALDLDIAEARAAVSDAYPWFSALSEPRQAVLVGMAFQLGADGVAEFVHTLGCMACGDYAGASQGMLASKWAKQTPKRVSAMAKQMRTGEWA